MAGLASARGSVGCARGILSHPLGHRNKGPKVCSSVAPLIMLCALEQESLGDRVGVRDRRAVAHHTAAPNRPHILGARPLHVGDSKIVPPPRFERQVRLLRERVTF
jgi:hypothetical protein